MKFLNPAHYQLLQLIRETHWGLIENLPIKNGVPDLSGSYRITRMPHLGEGQNPIRPDKLEKQLKVVLIQMAAHFHQVGDGVVHRIEVRNNLPCNLWLEPRAQ